MPPLLMYAEKTRHLKSVEPVARNSELGCQATQSTVLLCFLMVLETHQLSSSAKEQTDTHLAPDAAANLSPLGDLRTKTKNRRQQEDCQQTPLESRRTKKERGRGGGIEASDGPLHVESRLVDAKNNQRRFPSATLLIPHESISVVRARHDAVGRVIPVHTAEKHVVLLELVLQGPAPVGSFGINVEFVVVRANSDLCKPKDG